MVTAEIKRHHCYIWHCLPFWNIAWSKKGNVHVYVSIPRYCNCHCDVHSSTAKNVICYFELAYSLPGMK